MGISPFTVAQPEGGGTAIEAGRSRAVVDMLMQMNELEKRPCACRRASIAARGGMLQRTRSHHATIRDGGAQLTVDLHLDMLPARE